MSFDERILKLKQTSQGWLNYFRMGSIQGKLKELDGWLRNRLRYCIWHHWKKPERKRKNLIRLGVDPDHAYQWSRTRMGGWATAQSPILGTTITLERLRGRGYEALLTYYEKIAPHLNEPLYTRTAWFTLSEAEVYSGVRGALRQLITGGAVYSIGNWCSFISVCWSFI